MNRSVEKAQEVLDDDMAARREKDMNGETTDDGGNVWTQGDREGDLHQLGNQT